MAFNKHNSMDEADGQGPSSTGKGGAMRAVKITVAVVIIAVLALVIVRLAWSGWEMFNSEPIAAVSAADWQAVFLVNGQVYFGKVRSVGDKTLALSDIYYLQVVTKPLQTTQQGTAATAADTTGNQELTLIKLGNEIHGPADKMVINRDQIILTEKLKADSRVVQAISKYVSDQKKAATK